jgi:hypothetical protein
MFTSSQLAFSAVSILVLLSLLKIVLCTTYSTVYHFSSLVTHMQHFFHLGKLLTERADFHLLPVLLAFYFMSKSQLNFVSTLRDVIKWNSSERGSLEEGKP